MRDQSGNRRACFRADHRATRCSTKKSSAFNVPRRSLGPAPVANTVYYCYETASTIPVCSTTSPYLNGQPSAAIGGTSNLVFVGSAITDAHAVFVPAHRIGEQVIFRPTATESTTVNVTMGIGFTFEGGVASCSWVGGGPPWGACSVLLFYPATASAGIFDLHVINNNAAGANPSLISFIDPYPYFLPAANTPLIQAEIGIGAESGVGAPELQTVRLTLNANKIVPPYSPNYNAQGVLNPLGTLVAPIVDFGQANIAVVAVLRGYIEPVQRLSSR